MDLVKAVILKRSESEHLDLQMQGLSTKIEREKMKGDQKGSKCNFCHQATMGLDGLSAAIIPTAKSDPFSNSNSPFFADKEKMGSREMGVPYCRLERQMVTEKRSQIQSVSR